MQYTRAILYVSVDSFFAQVECTRNPDIADRPVVVVLERGRAGAVVVSLSAKAKKAGVEIGSGYRRTLRKCPEAVIIKADYDLYRSANECLLDLLSEYTPLLEPDNFGCAYMDITGSRNLFGEPLEIARKILVEIKNKLGYIAAVGCGINKLVAHAAFAGANSINLVESGKEQDFLKDIPVGILVDSTRDIVRVKDLKKRISELGIKRAGQLQVIPETLLVKQFGQDGNALYRAANGIDQSKVAATYPYQSIDIEHTCLYELVDYQEAAQVMEDLASEAYSELKKTNMLTGELMIRLHWEDQVTPAYFKFKAATDSRESILYALLKLLKDKLHPEMQIYKVQLRLMELDRGLPTQLCLFGTGEQKIRVDRTMQMIRGRFGEKSIVTAASLNQAI